MFQTMRNCWSVNAKSFSPPLFLFSHVMYVCVCVCVCVLLFLKHSFFFPLQTGKTGVDSVCHPCLARIITQSTATPSHTCGVAWHQSWHYGQLSVYLVAMFLWLWCAQGFCVCSVTVMCSRFLCLSCGQVSVSVLWPGFCVCLVARFLCLSCDQVSVSILWPSLCVCLMAKCLCVHCVARFLYLSCGQVSVSVSWPNFCVGLVAKFLCVSWPGFCVCLVTRFLCLSCGQVSMSVSWPGFYVCLVARFLWLSRGQVSVAVSWSGFCVKCVVRREGQWFTYQIPCHMEIQSCPLVPLFQAGWPCLYLSFWLVPGCVVFCCDFFLFFSLFLGWGGGEGVHTDRCHFSE